jgi:hypothetical protein
MGRAGQACLEATLSVPETFREVVAEIENRPGTPTVSHGGIHTPPGTAPFWRAQRRDVGRGCTV